MIRLLSNEHTAPPIISDIFVSYDGLQPEIRSVGLDALLERVGHGRFPRFIRLGGPKSHPLWLKSEIDAWIVSKVAEAQAKASTVLVEEFDGEPVLRGLS
jgi:hypothetical protein